MIEVISAGIGLCLQDYPGRLGYWDVGIPPSGPMDSLSFRIANKLVGNTEHAAGLEITAMGPVLRFHCDCVIALGGAEFSSHIDGRPVPWWEPVPVHKGEILEVGTIAGRGFRCYLTVRGGFEAPLFLGSRSTFAAGGFGGLDGKILQKGDTLQISKEIAKEIPLEPQFKYKPSFPAQWSIGIVPGPHGSPDYVTEEYMQLFLESEHTVNNSSNRMGIRLDGPKPVFSRADGGEGGSHPSNIIDTPYPIGGIILSGDTPTILGVDGPSFGGFIIFATVPSGEQWKLGQVQLGEKIRFHQMTFDEALQQEDRTEQILSLI